MSFLNPDFSTSSWYVPGGRFASVYSPATFVVVSKRKPVRLFITSILACGTVAFNGSVTRPVTEAFVDWARRTEGSKTRAKKTRGRTRRIASPPRGVGVPRLLSGSQSVNVQKSDAQVRR